MAKGKKELSAKDREAMLATLKKRFEANAARHAGVEWAAVAKRLEGKPEKLWSLSEMESTGGEPDVVGATGKGGEIVFMDCAEETPKGRRSVCYDREGLESRKEHRPANNAVDLAHAMGAEMTTEAEYRELQKVGPFDEKTSSWLATPDEIREKGGAIFGDYRYGQVFVYHNGAQSYYAARAFRCVLRV